MTRTIIGIVALVFLSGCGEQPAATPPTIEGDPIPEVYTSRADGTVEIISDMRQYSYAAKEVLRSVCTGPLTKVNGWIRLANCTDPAPL